MSSVTALDVPSRSRECRSDGKCNSIHADLSRRPPHASSQNQGRQDSHCGSQHRKLTMKSTLIHCLTLAALLQVQCVKLDEKTATKAVMKETSSRPAVAARDGGAAAPSIGGQKHELFDQSVCTAILHSAIPLLTQRRHYSL